jgi:excisionase family DNA binding protein
MATKLLTVRQAAEVLGEHPDTVRQRLRRGEIKGTKYSTGPKAHWRVTEAALDHFIMKRTQ